MTMATYFIPIQVPDLPSDMVSRIDWRGRIERLEVELREEINDYLADKSIVEHDGSLEASVDGAPVVCAGVYRAVDRRQEFSEFRRNQWRNDPRRPVLMRGSVEFLRITKGGFLHWVPVRYLKRIRYTCFDRKAHRENLKAINAKMRKIADRLEMQFGEVWIVHQWDVPWIDGEYRGVKAIAAAAVLGLAPLLSIPSPSSAKPPWETEWAPENQPSDIVSAGRCANPFDGRFSGRGRITSDCRYVPVSGDCTAPQRIMDLESQCLALREQRLRVERLQGGRP